MALNGFNPRALWFPPSKCNKGYERCCTEILSILSLQRYALSKGLSTKIPLYGEDSWHMKMYLNLNLEDSLKAKAILNIFRVPCQIFRKLIDNQIHAIWVLIL